MMKKIMITTVILTLVIIITVSYRMNHEELSSSRSIQTLIQQNIKVGSGHKVVETFFKSQNWNYTYHKDLRFLEARNLEEDKLPIDEKRHVVYVYFDFAEKVDRFEVVEVY